MNARWMIWDKEDIINAMRIDSNNRESNLWK